MTSTTIIESTQSTVESTLTGFDITSTQTSTQTSSTLLGQCVRYLDCD
jgi:hypothetical protein